MSCEQRHISYLLRLWRTKSRDEFVWRASIENPHTGERKGFASLTDLFAFLDQKIGHRIRGQATTRADEEGDNTEHMDS